MKAQAYEGYFEDGKFYPLEEIKEYNGWRRAFILILEEAPRNKEFELEKFFSELEEETDTKDGE